MEEYGFNLSHWPIHACICYCNFENLISHPGYKHGIQLNAVDIAAEMTTIQLWKGVEEYGFNLLQIISLTYIHARICYCNFENLISHPGYEHDSQLNAVDSAVEMTTIQLWKSTASTCCRLSHSPIHACIHYCNFEKLISHPGYKYHAPYRACMSPGNAHKLIRIYMGGLILGINTLYMLSCFLKQFALVGKGLT